MRPSDPNRFPLLARHQYKRCPLRVLGGSPTRVWCIEPTEFLNFYVEYTNYIELSIVGYPDVAGLHGGRMQPPRFHPSEVIYTYWDYGMAFRCNQGFRMAFILLNLPPAPG